MTRMILIGLVILAAGNGHAQTYVKVSDEKIGIVETIEKGEEWTVAELEHEIAGCVNDLNRIEDMKTPIADRMKTLQKHLDQCVTLGVTKPIEDKPVEPVEPIEDING